MYCNVLSFKDSFKIVLKADDVVVAEPEDGFESGQNEWPSGSHVLIV